MPGCLQELFEEYGGTSNAVLLEEQKNGGALFSLDFMRWLDETEQICSDPLRKEQLGALAGMLPAACRHAVSATASILLLSCCFLFRGFGPLHRHDHTASLLG